MRKQKGGLEPLHPKIKDIEFKYTTNISRKNWVKELYPYSEYLIHAVKNIDWDNYHFYGDCEYSNIIQDSYDDETPGEFNFVSETLQHFKPETPKVKNKPKKVGNETPKVENEAPNVEDEAPKVKKENFPSYYMFGGSAYELLNKIYTNVDLHTFCDPTGYIDIIVNLPKMPEHPTDKNAHLYFHTKDNTVNMFYKHFIDWLYNSFYKNIKIYESQLENMFPNFIEFDINDYDINPSVKTEHFLYDAKKVGNLYIVRFKENDMFKIQLVCKLNDTIDHCLEFILKLPFLDVDFVNNIVKKSPSFNKFIPDKFTRIQISNSTYNIQDISNLSAHTLSAYITRKTAIMDNEQYKNIHYKVYNHVGRFIYLHELLYNNPDLFNTPNDSYKKTYLFNFYQFRQLEKGNSCECLKYYLYKPIDIPLQIFMEAYQKILEPSFIQWYNNATNHKLNVNASTEQLEQNHDYFIQMLMNQYVRGKRVKAKTIKKTIAKKGKNTNKTKTKNMSIHEVEPTEVEPNKISTERYDNYHFIQEYLSSLSQEEKKQLPPGIIQIDETHSFYVKNTWHLNEVKMHSELTKLAIEEHFGGILLLFGYSDSYLKNGEQIYNLFIELSEGEPYTHDREGKLSHDEQIDPAPLIEVIPSVLWMHAHNYVHNDLNGVASANNVFILGSIHVIGDFDRTIYNPNNKTKMDEISEVFKKMPVAQIRKQEHLLMTIPGESNQIYLKGCDGIIKKLTDLIKENKRLFVNSDNVSMVGDAKKKITQYKTLLDEMVTLNNSPKLYMEFANALKQIYVEWLKTKKNLKKTSNRTRKKRRRHSTRWTSSR